MESVENALEAIHDEACFDVVSTAIRQDGREERPARVRVPASKLWEARFGEAAALVARGVRLDAPEELMSRLVER